MIDFISDNFILCITAVYVLLGMIMSIKLRKSDIKIVDKYGKSFAEIEAEFAGCGYGKFKPVVGEAVVEHLRPIREEATRLMKDKAYLESVYRDGAQRASYVAEKTLRKVYKKVGFVAK